MYRLYLFLRILMYPLVTYFLAWISPRVRERLEFERRNLSHINTLDMARYGFEISSEGELQQAKSLLLDLLNTGETVELVFCSDSVEQECISLHERYPDHLRIFRYPLLSFNPLIKSSHIGKWLTCEHLILCRYDFFPELIQYGKRKAKTFSLIAGSLQNYEHKSALVQKYLRDCYTSFDFVVAATKASMLSFEKELAIDITKMRTYDFRVIQILRRLKEKESKLNSTIPHFNLLKNYLENVAGKAFLLGSFWSEECDILESLKDDQHVFLVPHKLDESSMKALELELERRDIGYVFFNQKTSQSDLTSILADKNSIVILDFKGVLCELYSYFQYSYVGGGFGVSVHSLMEPYLAGSLIVCGPKVERSTEYTLIKKNSPERIHLVTRMDQVISEFENLKTADYEKFIIQYLEDYEKTKDWLLC